MLTILKKRNMNAEDFKEIKSKWGKNNHEITVNQISYEEEIDEKTGDTVIKKKVKQINLTRQINATAKLLKNDTAVQKLNQIKEIFSK